VLPWIELIAIPGIHHTPCAFLVETVQVASF